MMGDPSYPAPARYHFASVLRIDSNSRRRFALVFGYAILSSSNVSRTIWDTIRRAFSLSSAGTTYQGACLVLVAPRHSSYACHVVLPEFPLFNVRDAEFPVLFRLVDACEKALSLLLLGEVEEELDDAGSVDVEVFLQIHDRTIAVVPELLVVMWRVREPFAAGEFRGCTRTISTSS